MQSRKGPVLDGEALAPPQRWPKPEAPAVDRAEKTGERPEKPEVAPPEPEIAPAARPPIIEQPSKPDETRQPTEDWLSPSPTT